MFPVCGCVCAGVAIGLIEIFGDANGVMVVAIIPSLGRGVVEMLFCKSNL